MNRRPNTSYLVTGLVFLGIALTWALHEAGVVDGDAFRWLIPVTLLVAGLAGVVTSIAKGVGDRDHTDAPVVPHHDEPYDAARP